jgi:prepilin-type N-terminal cleavage/methylation domain-containing protein
MKRIQQKTGLKAFTLIELLVVIAIIAMLVGIMSVGIRKAMTVAKNLRQKAEFKAMETGLELFAKDFDDYPDSKVLPNIIGNNQVCGAHHLAEALVGRDERGFDPKSKWYAPTDRTTVSDLYTDNQTSLIRRKGAYVQLKQGGFYTLDDLWGTGNIGTIFPSDRTGANPNIIPVVTDTFARILPANTSITQKIGMPILYFKADETKRFRTNSVRTEVNRSNLTQVEYQEWAFNFDDNLPIARLSVLTDPTKQHFESSDDLDKAWSFYEDATQTADTDRVFFKPYNASTFILISAGWDGVYGTKDDITNYNY